ncbi:MAG: hypothetical protein ABI760_18130 [Ferruginibacter sp.]
MLKQSPFQYDLVKDLSRREEDHKDQNIPFVVCYAMGPLAQLDPSRATAIAIESKLQDILT